MRKFVYVHTKRCIFNSLLNGGGGGGEERAGRGSFNCFILLAAIVELTGNQDCNSHHTRHCTEHISKMQTGNNMTSCCKGPGCQSSPPVTPGNWRLCLARVGVAGENLSSPEL